MKNIYLLFVLTLFGQTILYAQDLEDINKYIQIRQYQKAKDGVDKFLADASNANNPKAWYYKAFTYNVLSRDANQSILQSQNLNKEAFFALKKYIELDPQQKLTKSEENATIFNIYVNFYDIGVKAYTNKELEQSYLNFANTLEVHDYILTNNFIGNKSTKLPSLDTNVVFNLVLVGEELKKTDELIPYYKKLVDANLSDEKYLGTYEGLVILYKNAKNKAAFDEYLAKGKNTFPKEKFWEDIDIEYSTEGLEKEALFNKYEELTKKYTNNYVLFYYYGYELNKYVYSDEPKTGDMNAYKAKIPELFKNAIAIKSTVEANMLLASFYYNNSFDLSDEAKKIKGTKPEDVKKKQDLNNASKNSLKMSIPVAEEATRLYAAMPKLKGSEKVLYKQAFDILIDAYKTTGDAKKAEEYEKKKAEVDKL